MDNIQSGQMLGPYRIIGQIGKGGMANVYKAYQASMDRYVAIKVLPSQLGESQEFATRFQQEARIIAKLEHPHILPVFDYGESDGVTYFVMRYLEAGTLKDKMEAGRPLPLQEIDRIFTQLTDALSYAHSYGVVHRDLKPANALIDSHGNIFLTDFGIAKLLESASPRLTQTDAIMGTPAYISPEQAQAQPVDQRSDIYSLGIILYEMVTGRVPFVADTPLAILFKHVTDPLPLPSLIKPDVPESIEQVILKALAKDPKDRFATAAEFLSAWKAAREEKETVRWEPETASTPASRPIAPPPATRAALKRGGSIGWVAGCLAGACLLFSVAGVILVALNWQNLSPAGPGTDTPLPAETAGPAPATDSSLPTEIVEPGSSAQILLADDFSPGRSTWGTLTDSDSSIEYEGQALRMQVFMEDYFVWSTPNGNDYENIHMEVTAINNDTDPTTAFGMMCGHSGTDLTAYYFAITPAGDYAIARAAAGQTTVFLTNDDRWGSSDLIAQNASSYRIGVDCGNGILTLYVDGRQIDSVSDDTYPAGGVALFTWSGLNAPSADVTFDDFLLTSLE